MTRDQMNSNSNNIYLEYSDLTDYVIPQQQQFNAADLIYHQPSQQVDPTNISTTAAAIAAISNNRNTVTTMVLPQSPEASLQCDENADTSYCTSPSSILSTSSNNNNNNNQIHQQQPFPSPSPSPYQHAFEVSHPSNTNALNILDSVPLDNTHYYPAFLPACDTDFIMTHTSNNASSNGKKKRRLDSESETSKADKVANSELRRQIHIQSEQKRRAQIKDGFEELRNELPTCLNKKMSKVALLQRTVQHIQHLKSTQVTILSELERILNENNELKKFQESVLQKQQRHALYSSPSHTSSL